MIALSAQVWAGWAWSAWPAYCPEAARIDDFTWRDMTLVFSNSEMAERVRAMNPAFAENTTPDVATETPATPAEELSI